MCPNCIRGLKNGEVCEQCAGTGFWNPQSLPANEIPMPEETVIAPAVEEAPAAPEVAPEAPVEAEVAPEAPAEVPAE